MNINSEHCQLIVKGKLFHYTDCLSNPQPVIDLIKETNTVFKGVMFDADLSVKRLKRKRPSSLKPTKKNWSKIVTELQKGEIGSLLYGSLGSLGKGWQVGIYFHMFNEKSRQYEPELWLNYDSMGFWVEHRLFLDGKVNLEDCAMFLHKAWGKFQGVYGFIDLFVSHHTGQTSSQELVAISRLLKAKVSGDHDSLRVDPRLSVPDAYWLNLLNARHVEALGGIERIQASLPTAQVKPLTQGGAFIQLSPSPLYDSIEDWQANHTALAKILAPIIRKM